MWSQNPAPNQQLLHFQPVGMPFIAGQNRTEIGVTAQSLAHRPAAHVQRSATNSGMRTGRRNLPSDEGRYTPPTRSPRYNGESGSHCSRADKKEDITPLEGDDVPDTKCDSPTELIPERTDNEIIDAIRLLFDEFTVARHNEEIDTNNMEVTKATAKTRRNFVNDRLNQTKRRYAESKVVHEKTVSDLGIYRGDTDCLGRLNTEQLEEVCDTLNRAKESATVAQALYNTTKHPEDSQATQMPLLSEKERKHFEVPQLPTRASSARPDDLISKLIEELQLLGERETRNLEALEDGYLHIQQVQAEHEQLIAAYTQQVDCVQELERKQHEMRKELDLLTNSGDLTPLSVDELQALSANIGKFLRKVHLALAVQQLQSKGGSGKGGITQTENGMCVVCYELRWNTSLSPCGHVLCETCAQRLKFCPTCRAAIKARQRMYVQ